MLLCLLQYACAVTPGILSTVLCNKSLNVFWSSDNSFDFLNINFGVVWNIFGKGNGFDAGVDEFIPGVVPNAGVDEFIPGVVPNAAFDEFEIGGPYELFIPGVVPNTGFGEFENGVVSNAGVDEFEPVVVPNAGVDEFERCFVFFVVDSLKSSIQRCEYSSWLYI